MRSTTGEALNYNSLRILAFGIEDLTGSFCGFAHGKTGLLLLLPQVPGLPVTEAFSPDYYPLFC